MARSDSAPAGFPRPRLVVSRCLGFEPVRYNGQIIDDDFVQRLAGHCDVVLVCPEVEIGLGVPRPPVRLVRRGDATCLIQPETGRDLSAEMDAFAERFLNGLEHADGFVLKARSPSCGLRDAKVFSTAEDNAPVGRSAGAFASVVQRRFAAAALEDEASLRDGALRERFLTLLFGLARLRALGAGGPALAGFHSSYEPLLLAYDESRTAELGRVAREASRRPWEEAIRDYREGFALALARPVSPEILASLRGWTRLASPALDAQACLQPYPPALAHVQPAASA